MGSEWLIKFNVWQVRLEKWKYQSEERLYTLERQNHHENFKWHRDELGLIKKYRLENSAVLHCILYSVYTVYTVCMVCVCVLKECIFIRGSGEGN